MKIWVIVVGVVFCSLMASLAGKEDMVPTDFTAAYMPVEELGEKLAANGLTVLGMHDVAGNTNYTSIIYSSPDLKKLGSEPGRGFVSVMRILHDAKARRLVVSNPEYYIRAFYQKDYKDGMEAPAMKALVMALGKLEPTEDSLEAKKLAKYKFMIGMPKYDDFERVAKGSVAELCSKLEKNAKDRIVFKLDIKGDGSSMLYGVALPGEIEKFNETLETMGQSQLLPYTVLIENGQANILHAKFYLAVSFPRLTMGEFMKIMSIPGDIKDQFEDYFE